jgi:N-methylhydantoinase B
MDDIGLTDHPRACRPRIISGIINATMTLNAITLEIIRGGLLAAQAECEALLERTALSPVIREKQDYFIGFYDGVGALVTGTKLRLFGDVLRPILARFPIEGIEPEDIFWYNDCYFSRGGVLNEEVFRIFTRNSRFPDMLKGDLNAIMAACGLGKQRLEEVIARFGAPAVEGAFAYMLDQSADALQRAFDDRVPDGEYSFGDHIDCDAVTDDPYSVHLTMRKADGRVVYDFSESEDQAAGPINFVMDDSVPKFMTGLYLTMHDPNIRMNSGFERPIDEIVTRAGSIVDPIFPAPLGLRSHTMIRVNAAIFGVLAQATGGQASAASCVYVLYYLRSHDNKTGQTDLCIEGLSVGFGGRPHADGIDAVYYVAQKNYPIEFAEMEFGVRIEAFRIHLDSGGAGVHRGGCGIIRDVRVLADNADLGIRLDNCKLPAFGANGGLCRQTGRVIVNPDSDDVYELKTMSDGNSLKKNDLLRIITPGGGGWGNPLLRPTERVLDDVLDGFISVAAAARDYGVILDADGLVVDDAVPEAARAELAGERGMFHRGELFGGPAGQTLLAAE